MSNKVAQFSVDAIRQARDDLATRKIMDRAAFFHHDYIKIRKTLDEMKKIGTSSFESFYVHPVLVDKHGTDFDVTICGGLIQMTIFRSRSRVGFTLVKEPK